MRKIFGVVCAATLTLGASLFTLFPGAADAYVSVKGYYRSNGTYVRPHVRSEPNGLKYDNYSWTPSQGLYNKTYGTKGALWDTPTYLTDPDYDLGKSLYESGSSRLNYDSSLDTRSASKIFKSSPTYSCGYGLVKSGDECIDKPEHSQAIGDKWLCDPGYRKKNSKCVLIPNATKTDTGVSCKANYFYSEDKNRCVKGEEWCDADFGKKSWFNSADNKCYVCNPGFSFDENSRSCI